MHNFTPETIELLDFCIRSLSLNHRNASEQGAVLTKAQRQAAEADSKTVNTRVDNAMAARNAKNNKAHNQH